MKIRFGFVSNSSSTSFTCDVCGENAAGMDLSLNDAGMYECVNGHVYCEVHGDEHTEEILTKAFKALQEQKPETDKGDDEYDISEAVDEARYEMPAILCPLCLFEHVADRDLLTYILKRDAQTRTAVCNEVREKFKSYEGYEEYCKGK